MKIPKIASRIVTIFTIAIGAWAIYWLFLKLTGHSPTFDQVIIVMLTLIGGSQFALVAKLNKLEGRFIENAKNTEKRFDSIERKIDIISSDIKNHLSQRAH